MDTDLVCNFKKCRKRLSTFAWVSSCSHIFCDEDGTREFKKSLTCPACENSLSGEYDIIRINLQPSDTYKSMVLAGHKPETIMEICTRALSFWTYQAHQERIYQEYVSGKAKDKALQLEQYYEQMVSRIQTELTSSKKDLENLKNKYNEVTDKLTEKNRQYQKLQSMYDAMRRKCITPSTFEGGDRVMDCRMEKSLNNFSLPLSSGDDLLKKNNYGKPMQVSHSSITSPTENRNFVLRPSNTPVMTSGQPSDYHHSRFNLPFGTPK